MASPWHLQFFRAIFMAGILPNGFYDSQGQGLNLPQGMYQLLEMLSWSFACGKIYWFWGMLPQVGNLQGLPF